MKPLNRMMVREGDPTSYDPARLIKDSRFDLVELQHLIVTTTDCTFSTAAAVIKAARGSLATINTAALTDLAESGTDEARVIMQLRCALELGRRHQLELCEPRAKMRGPKDVAMYAAPMLEALEHEEFHVLLLDAQHRLKQTVMITRGLLNSSLVHPREVFAEAIKSRAAAVILVHNHPSGDPTPSAEDRAVTEQLVAAGRLLDLPVHDHIIIGRGRYLSFVEAGLL